MLVQLCIIDASTLGEDTRSDWSCQLRTAQFSHVLSVNREGARLMNTLLHVAAEIFFVSVGIFAVWAIHNTLKGK